MIISQMKKILVTLTILTLAFSLSALGCRVGASAGLSVNSVIAGKGYRNYEYGEKSGLFLSADLVLDLDSLFGIETGIGYIGRNYTVSRKAAYAGSESTVLSYTVSNSFLLVPLQLRFTLSVLGSDGGDRLMVLSSVGGYASWWLTGRRRGKELTLSYSADVDEKTDLDLYNRFDGGLLTSLALVLESGDTQWNFRLSYLLSLTDMNRHQDYGAYPIHNSTFIFSSGILWRTES